jgi:uroporphyrin-III C-methyltransferase/precorrin-2 dehydrogenase/sirohydrochlorin ferrochelatase
MVKLATAGKRVVRLMPADPLVQSAMHEEIAAARAKGISVEIVPGIGASFRSPDGAQRNPGFLAAR